MQKNNILSYLSRFLIKKISLTSLFAVSISSLLAQTVDVVQILNADNSPLPHNQVNALSVQDNVLWIGTEGGIAQVLGGQWQVYTTNNSVLPDDRVRSMAISDNTVLAGTFAGGLAVYDGITWVTHNTTTSGLADNNVKCIALTDTNSTIWLGTTGGISVWHTMDNAWTTYFNVSADLSLNNINHIVFDSEQIAWIATLNAGLIALNSDGEGFLSYKITNSDIPDNSINKIVITPNEDKWFTTAFHGLVRLGADHSWTIFDPANSPLTTPQLTALWRDDNGILFIGSQDDGLFIANLETNTWQHINTSNSDLPHDHVTDIIAQNDSMVWVATDGGGIAQIVYRDFATSLAPNKPLFSSNNLQIYPNPAKSGGLIRLIYGDISGNNNGVNFHNDSAICKYFKNNHYNINHTTIQLLNSQGQIVAKLPFSLPESTIQLPTVPMGCYWLQVLVDGELVESASLFIE